MAGASAAPLGLAGLAGPARAARSSKRKAPKGTDPTTFDGWKRLKESEIVSRSHENSAEHQLDYKLVARWYRSQGPEYENNGYLEFQLNTVTLAAGRRSAKRDRLVHGTAEERERAVEAIRADGEGYAREMLLAGETRDLCRAQFACHYAEFRMAFDACVHTHNLDQKSALLVFHNPNGKAAVWWNADREHEHRNEIVQKTSGKNPSILPGDPVLEKWGNFRRGPGLPDVPVSEFISSRMVEMTRSSNKQAGKSAYTTLISRPTRAVDESGTLRTFRVGERTPPSLWPVWGNIKGGKGGGGRPDAPAPWVPVPKDLVENLSPALCKFAQFKSYGNGPYKTANNNYSTKSKQHGAAFGHCHARGIGPARSGKRRQQALPLPEHTALGAPLNLEGDAAAEELAAREETQSLQTMWAHLMLVVNGRVPATVHTYFDILAALLNTEAAVFAFGDVLYAEPSELAFRNVVKDKMSFARPQLRAAIKDGWFVGVEPKFVPASNGAPAYQEYTLRDGTVHRVYPYAARLNSNKLLLHVNFALMRACHRDAYDDLSGKVKEWYQRGLEGGGFRDLRAVRRRTDTDDPVFGNAGPNGKCYVLPRVPFINGLPGNSKLWRHRLPRFDEAGLPPTDHLFLAEFEWKRYGIWIVWSNKRFYAEERPLVWKALPQDAGGVLRPLNWLPGDDKPSRGATDAELREWERSHEYGIVDSEALLPYWDNKEKELPPMF